MVVIENKIPYMRTHVEMLFGSHLLALQMMCIIRYFVALSAYKGKKCL